MFRYTNTYHCVIKAYSIQYSNVLYSIMSYEQQAMYLVPWAYSGLYHLGLWKCTL